MPETKGRGEGGAGIGLGLANAAAIVVARDAASACRLRAQLTAMDCGQSRETSLAVTKLEEAAHWLEALAARLELSR